MFTNRKYTGNVQLLKEDEAPTYYLAENNNPLIISEEIFNAVQKMSRERANAAIDEVVNKKT